MWKTAFLGIGSNLGDRQENCLKAAAFLKKNSKIKVAAISKWYETDALLPENAAKGENPRWPRFINGVVKIETELSLDDLLAALQSLESRMGRIRGGIKWEPRIIDLDILAYGNSIVDTHDLKIPHPELHKRIFVLRPLCDIAPDWIHPVLKKTAKELMEALL